MWRVLCLFRFYRVNFTLGIALIQIPNCNAINSSDIRLQIHRLIYTNVVTLVERERDDLAKWCADNYYWDHLTICEGLGQCLYYSLRVGEDNCHVFFEIDNVNLCSKTECLLCKGHVLHIGVEMMSWNRIIFGAVIKVLKSINLTTPYPVKLFVIRSVRTCWFQVDTKS